MWATPYIYNGDRNAIPTDHLRVVLERDKGEFDYIAYVWGWELDISCMDDDPQAAIEQMLCSLESLGFEGVVEVDGIDGSKTVTLGKTEDFYTTFGYGITGRG